MSSADEPADQNSGGSDATGAAAANTERPSPDEEPTAATPEPPDGSGYEPPARAGYRAGTPFRYSALALGLLSAVVSPVALVAFAWLATATAGVEAAFPFVTFVETADGFTFTLDAVQFGVVFVGSLAGTVVLHELVHGLAYRLLGFRVSFGTALRMGAFYTAVFEQFQSRRELAVAVAAPLAVLTPVGVLLLLVPGAHVPFVWFALVVNTGGAVGDLFVLWRLRQLPAGTLFYDVDAYTSYVYDPAE